MEQIHGVGPRSESIRRITKIEVEGFKSIRTLDLDLRPVNVIVGENATGKSCFLSLIYMLNYVMSGSFQRWVAEAGYADSVLFGGLKGGRSLKCAVTFEQAHPNGKTKKNVYDARWDPGPKDTLQFTLEALQFDEQERRHPARITLPGVRLESALLEEPSNDATPTERTTRQTVRFLLNRCRFFHFHDTSPSSHIRNGSRTDDHLYLRWNGGNLAAFLRQVRTQRHGHYDRIVHTIRQAYPAFVDFVLEPEPFNGGTLFLRCRDSGHAGYDLGPHQISDGSLRFMTLATLFLQPEETLPDIIVVDEPELGLHPRAVRILAELMRAFAREHQVIAATQSMFLVDLFDPEDVVVAERRRGATELSHLDAAALRAWLEEYSLSELIEKNVTSLDEVKTPPRENPGT